MSLPTSSSASFLDAAEMQWCTEWSLGFRKPSSPFSRGKMFSEEKFCSTGRARKVLGQEV